MHIAPQLHKCIRCDYEFQYSPHDRHTAPATSEGDPVCPQCWDKFLATVGLGYCSVVWNKDGSEYEKALKQQKKSPEQSDQILAIAEALRKHGLTLVKTAAGYDVMNLGVITAQSQKKSPGQSDHSAVHLHHCNIGEYEGSCKYGDGDCPAMDDAQEPVAYWIPKAEQFCIADPSCRPFVKAWEPLYTSPPKNIRVHGWVWKDKQTEDDCYIPSYTPAQHVPRGELLALVDPADLHQPLENTKWF